MKAYIALPLLVGAVLAAPQQQNATRDNKPFKEPATDMSGCYVRDDSPTLQARPPTYTEDCTGTIEYCLRGFYKHHGEDFADADACLWSRGKDPKTLDAYRILNNDDYHAGIRALQQGNQIYNRYLLITRLIDTHVADDKDKEGNDIINNLWWSNERRVPLARESLDLAKRKFATAFGPEFSGEINQAIDDARAKLNAAWTQVKETNVNHISDLYGWFRGKTEEKYYKSW
ncbi:hypothetical protein H634G_09231 [Metarhizium anisopliae BRIP 53293]|uniref:Uncharacterized protein n=1 Tax=Metarhizium anisopliae BRIP 53293 TaxID=1291518 RepID=A0A0D9NP74_METAN|nr:hypothetical protein H634G_09231 [Metarhizium anisopliae BRIP 53293]KJK87885.1 hypothetical protein H633G_08266 [Metarhizium anisopliae BRIP 53284]